MSPQKGTGRARHQDRGAPIFIGGGHALPVRPRDYSFKLNRRVRHLALRMALTTKYLQGKLTIVDDLKLEQAKTKQAFKIVTDLGVNEKKDAFIIDGLAPDTSFERATWNLPYVQYVRIQALNVYDMLRREHLIITKSSLELIKKRWARYDLGREE